MRDHPPPGRYRHFKGSDYQVLGVALHSETQEALVIYHAVGKPEEWWARPRAMFEELIDTPTGEIRRFERV